ncbi:hypothetical protein M0805_000951 [Coniferiporia weirii]|nr:hypothetical protein M0805_000951 [Coniferiporia weirii]
MKWRGFHRDQAADIPADVDNVPQNAIHPTPSFDGTSPFASNLADPAGDFTAPSASARGRSDVLLITDDIEALLQEDERSRSQAAATRNTESGRAAPIGTVVHISPSDSTAGPFIGLPAPPRAPRRPAQSGRGLWEQPAVQNGGHSPARSARTSRVAVEKIMDAQRSSVSAGAVPSLTDSSPPSIKGVPIESASSLGMDVMNALNMHQILSGPEEPHSQSAELAGDHAQGVLEGRSSMPFDTASRTRSKCNLPFSDIADSSMYAPMRTTAQLPTRPLLSHASTNSRNSDLSHSSFSSHDPASTLHEPRISISSTIYPSSDYEALPSPITHAYFRDQSEERRSSPSYGEIDQGALEDSCSILDLATPTTSEHDINASGRLASPIPKRLHSYDSPRAEVFDGTVLPRRPLSASSNISRRASPGAKPALPTTPKPDFRRSRSVQPSLKSSMTAKPPSPSSSPKTSGRIPYHLLTSLSRSDPSPVDSLPPTRNNLSPQERAELIRKTRKLTQVLGQTPSPLTGSEELGDSPLLNSCLLPMMAPRKVHARGALSVSDASAVANTAKGLQDQHLSAATSERTDPLSPITFRSSSLARGNESDDSMSPFESPAARTPRSTRKKSDVASIRSPTIISASDSFMELSDTDIHSLIRFSSTYSLADSVSDTQKAEEERRRKRERLAKLHRFLGSRVPPELILGPHEVGAPLPAPGPGHQDQGYTLSDGETPSSAKLWIRGKRRNSLASSDPLERLADTERIKERLSEREKAIVVKRALKMERMFGEQPPQDLFHTDRPRLTHRAVGRTKQSKSAVTKSAPSSPTGGNVNKTAYRKGKQSKHNSDRPGTAESRKRLIESGETTSGYFGNSDAGNDGSSDVYFHYRSSLISLTNIVNNDDRKSLVELHEYINEDSTNNHQNKHDWDSRSSIRSERRRSLPLRASQMSLASQYTIAEVKTEITPFEVRRRRAAKLSHFFGVSYRNLFGEVLDSIEMGVREDEGKGTLNADEAKDLLTQLTNLKKRRDEIS